MSHHFTIPPGCRFVRTGRQSIDVYEPLKTNAGRDAKPYCCYFSTVIFYACYYHPDFKIDEVERRFTQGAWSDCFVWWNGSWWCVGCGQVVWKDGQWWAAVTCWRNDRGAILRNGEGFILKYENHKKPWWRHLPRWLRDLMRQWRILPGRPAKHFEYTLGWEDAEVNV